MRDIISGLEAIIVGEFRPTFLSIHAGDVDPPDFIHVVISAREFSNMSVDKRVALVYKKIKDQNPKLLEKFPVIVETFSSSEMADVFEYIK